MHATTRFIRQGLYQFIAVFVLACVPAFAQDEQWKSLGADEIFQKARPKAFTSSERAEARKMLAYILQRSPDYHDVRILLARTFAWDGVYDSARQHVQRVLNVSPDHEDALNASIDTELWSEKYEEALRVSEKALKSHPNNRDFIFKKASALNNLKQEDEALVLLQQILTIDPGNQPAAKLQQAIKKNKLKYALGLSYSLDAFSRTFNTAHYASIQLSRINRWGSSIVRVNYINRFSKIGIQPEIDLYPRIANGTYAYLNYGYSSSTLFPNHRVGAELFKNLPKSLEVSAGLRYLSFDDTTRVYIFTGSLGWYVKNYWLSLRPFITPDKETGTSYSTSINLRRYFSDADNYFGVSGGFGFTPDDRRLQSGGGLTTDQLYILKSQRLGIAWQKTFRANIILNLSMNLSRQEQTFDVGNYLWITSGSVWVRKQF
jgi:YaiO family outer membrane protein